MALGPRDGLACSAQDRFGRIQTPIRWRCCAAAASLIRAQSSDVLHAPRLWGLLHWQTGRAVPLEDGGMEAELSTLLSKHEIPNRLLLGSLRRPWSPNTSPACRPRQACKKRRAPDCRCNVTVPSGSGSVWAPARRRISWQISMTR